MSIMEKVTLSCQPNIAAIYFALYHSGYDYHALGREAAHLEEVQRQAGQSSVPAFFSGARQTTCEVYPYWPRAAILETASFYLREDFSGYEDEAALRTHILSAPNLTDEERDDRLWDWLSDFPKALHTVLESLPFQRYLSWLQTWTHRQEAAFQQELRQLRHCLEVCRKQYGAPVHDLQVVIDPIKCAYSADYHLIGRQFIFCSGRMQADSIVHEFLHHVVHSLIAGFHPALVQPHVWPDLDRSYYLDGSIAGQANAFEEHAVRCLTADLLAQRDPTDLSAYLAHLLSNPAKESHHE